LAAVIISAMIISLGVGTNRAVTSEKPNGFYDFSYNVQREIGAVVDYNIYSNFANDTNLTVFTNLLANSVAENNLGANFVIIYGNDSGVIVRNYGTNDVYIDNSVEIKGVNNKATSTVCADNICKSVDGTSKDFTGINSSVVYVPLAKENLPINFGGVKFNFPLSSYPQVIFIIQKNIRGNRNVVVG